MRIWLRRWWWRIIVKPYVDKIVSPEDCGDFSGITGMERWHGNLMITTERHLYAVGDRFDFIDLQMEKVR